MPLIKTSALISDIKGKANGSVFARGSSGVYFRNNPSGGGKKSTLWDSQKSRFSFLAGQWRALTPAQQEEWNAAGELYPTTNKFGEIRIPSGYELFMRLNGVRLSIDLDLNTSPGSPREIPSLPVPSLYGYSGYAYVPTKVLSLVDRYKNNFFAYAPEFFKNADFSISKLFGCKFQLDSNVSPSFVPDTVYPLFSGQFESSSVWALVLICSAAGELSVEFRFSIKDEAPNWLTIIFASTSPLPDFTELTHVALSGSVDGTINPTLSINGVYIPFDLNKAYLGALDLFSSRISGTPTDVPADLDGTDLSGSFAIGAYDNSVPLPMRVSDFRYAAQYGSQPSCCGDPATPCEWGDSCVTFPDGCSCVYTDDLYAPDAPMPNGPIDGVLWSHGYILENETALVKFDRVVDGFCQNETSLGDNFGFWLALDPECSGNEECEAATNGNGDVECIGGICVYTGDSVLMEYAAAQTFKPLVYVAPYTFEGSDFYLEVTVSKIVGLGRNGNQVSYTRLGVFEMNGKGFNLSELIASKFGGIPNDGALYFNMAIIDGLNGYRYDTSLEFDTWTTSEPMAADKKKPKRRVGFKAGADLSGKMH